jgi:hypothetical protein
VKPLVLFALRACAVILLVSAIARAGEAATAATPAPPRAHLRPLVCKKALDPPDRQVSVTAVMRPVQGTEAMAIKFDLLERSPGLAAFTAPRAGDLGTWISPVRPTLGKRAGDVWVLSKPVANLPAPASYRFRVSFRWTGAAGKVLATAERDTRWCSEPELRPDPLVQSIRIEPVPDHPKQAKYTVVIRNAGATAAGPFQLEFAPADGVGVKTRTIQRLGGHVSRNEVFTGRACTSTTAPTVTLDPEHVVDDLSVDNDVLAVPASCPVLTTR